MNKDIKKRLEYLRGEIKAERISTGEIAELQSLAPYIEPGDVELLEWAGVPEFEEDKVKYIYHVETQNLNAKQHEALRNFLNSLNLFWSEEEQEALNG